MAAPESVAEDDIQLGQVGAGSAATAFIRGLLEYAIDDYSDEIMHEVLDNEVVLVDSEPPMLEPEEDLTLDFEDSLDAELVLPASDGEYFDEETLSIASFDASTIVDAAAESEVIAEKMATDIVALSQAAAEAAILELPPAGGLPKCARRKFERRLPPRHLPPMEEPFPLDCLPLSAPVAREMPPSAELATLRAASPSPAAAREEAISHLPAASSSPSPLSSEAEERLLRSATAGFEALWAAARLEAAETIQKTWRATQARTQLQQAKTALVASEAVEKASVATFRMDDGEAAGATQRETSVAGAYAALDAEVFNMAQDSGSDGETKKPRGTGRKAPRAPPCRPTTAPNVGAAPAAPPGAPPAGRGDPRRRKIGALMIAAQTAEAALPGGIVPTPPPGPRRPTTSYEARPVAPPQTPRTGRPGSRIAAAPSTGGQTLIPHPPATKPPGSSHGGRRPLGAEAQHIVQAATTAAPGGAAASAPLAPVRPPTTPRAQRPAHLAPAPTREQEPAVGAAAPSAMELDLGMAPSAAPTSPGAAGRPTSRGRSLFDGVEMPRISKSVGTGLLPRVAKNGSDTITWTVGSGHVTTPRAPMTSRIDRGAVY